MPDSGVMGSREQHLPVDGAVSDLSRLNSEREIGSRARAQVLDMHPAQSAGMLVDERDGIDSRCRYPPCIDLEADQVGIGLINENVPAGRPADRCKFQ